MKSFWDSIIFELDDLKPLIDYGTVRRLQLRNPWASRIDRNFITEAMEREQLFPLITEPSLRSRSLGRILKIDHIIPTLYIFFEDTKWLEPCAKILRKLAPLSSRKETIRQSLLAHHYGRRATGGVLPMLTYKNTINNRDVSEHEHVEFGYRRLWLFAWRHFPGLSAILPRRDQGHAKPQSESVNEQCWRQLALVAENLGFQSDHIVQLKEQNTDLEMAKAFLNRTRLQEFYPLTQEKRRAAAEDICQMLAHISSTENSDTGATDSSHEMEVPINNRCGRPFQ